ncbi:hypothetical protein QE443_000015 [Pantoea ananatis]|nr:hypothetical protein [Pantoea ananatis]MDR6092617.1 hypothetical protein [Pantoea ananatis]REC88695.1 hypothetical protein C7423_1308 [Pantoea ananatis]
MSTTDGTIMQHTLAERFDSLEDDYEEVLATKSIQFISMLNANKMYVDSAKYKTWIGRVKKLLEDSYGKDSVTCPRIRYKAQLVMSDPSLSELPFLQLAANSDGV